MVITLKNKLLVLSVGIIMSTQIITAQIPSIEWQKCFGGTLDDDASSIQQTTDGGYILAGTTSSNDGDVSGNHGLFGDLWVVKINSLGTIQWQKCLGGTSGDVNFSIQQTTDEGFILAGYTASNDGDVSGNHGDLDSWVVKLSSAGDIEWQKCLGGTSVDDASSIQQTTDGGYIVSGATTSNDGDVTENNGGQDLWVVKLSIEGTIQWQKRLGGTSVEYFGNIKQTNDDGYIVAGRTSSNNGDVSGNHGTYDNWLVKLDSVGNFQWQKCLGGSSFDFFGSIQITNDGGYIIAGYTESNDGDVSGNHGDNDIWIVKLDSVGALQWQKCLGGTLSDYPGCVKQTVDGGYIVAGMTYSNDGNILGNHGDSDIWIVKLNTTGIIEWQKCLGGTLGEVGGSIQQTSDGGYIVAGSNEYNDSDISGNHGGKDFWVVKLSPDPLQIHEFDTRIVSIAPNPASTQININFNNITDLNGGTLKVINSLGQEVATTPITTSGTQSIMQLATWGGSGMYYVQIINPQGIVVDVKKIILQ